MPPHILNWHLSLKLLELRPPLKNALERRLLFDKGKEQYEG
jgi:hypothetical protein